MAMILGAFSGSSTILRLSVPLKNGRGYISGVQSCFVGLFLISLV